MYFIYLFIFSFNIAGVPKGLSFSLLKASLLDIPGVLAVHDLHVWSLTVGTTAIAVHLVIGEGGHWEEFQKDLNLLLFTSLHYKYIINNKDN